LELDKKVSIGELREWLSNEAVSTVLDSAFNNTRRRVALIRAAELRATSVRDGWLRAERDPHYQWLDDGATIERWATALSDPRTPRLASAERDVIWRLRSLLSLELLMAVAKLSAAQRGVLVATAAKATTGYIGRRIWPWDKELPNAVAAMPIAALYVSDPSQTVYRLVLRFVDAGGTNVGHLATLEPTIWSAIRRSQQIEWIRLRRMLHAP
jgi:hypothetical protein